MKYAMKKLLAAILAAAMILSLALTAGAAEVRGSADFDDIIKGVTPDHFAAESLQKAAGSSGALGVFALKMDMDDSASYVTAFLLEKNGDVYLVADGNFVDIIAKSKLTLKTSGNGGYSQKASVVGSDMYFVYLAASGLEDFTCLSVANEVPNAGILYVEAVKNGETAGLSSVKVDFSNMDVYSLNNSEDVAAFDINEQPLDIILGAPVVVEGTTQVYAIGSADKHPETGNVHPVYYTILDADLEESYALTSSGGNSGGENRDDDDPGKTEEPDDRREDRDDPEEDEEQPEEKNYLWLIGAVVVAVAAFLIYRSRSRDGAAPGKVELEKSEIIPAAPEFEAEPASFVQWQVRGLSGCFSGQTFPMNSGLRMGRSAQCQIRFPEGTPGISSNHCELAMENGSLLLTDLGSSYGTFLRGSKLIPNTPGILNPGETFTLAEGESFRVEQMGQAEAGGIAVRDAQGREYRTHSSRMSFGRGQDNKVVFSSEDKGVSSSHCVLYKEDGKLYLMDTGSTNGTFFTEENRLKPNTPYRIRRGMAFFLVNRKNTFVVLEE